MPRPIIIKILGIRIPQASGVIDHGAAHLDDPNVFTEVNTFPGLRVGTVVITEDYELRTIDFEVLADASLGNIIVSLPAALGTGQIYRVKRIDDSVNTVTLMADGSDLIDADSSFVLSVQYADCTVVDAANTIWDKFTGGGNVGDVAYLSQANVFTNLNTLTGVQFGTQTVTEDYTLTVLDYELLVDGTLDSIDITLPPATGSGQVFRVKKIDDTSSIIAIIADGTDTIDGSISLNLDTQWADCTIIDAAPGYWDNTGGLEPLDPSFTDLVDVPSSYTGEALKVVRVNAAEDGLEFAVGGGGASAWGGITGTLSDQTDLQSALDAKQPLDAGLTFLADYGDSPTGTSFELTRSLTNQFSFLLTNPNAHALATTFFVIDSDTKELSLQVPSSTNADPNIRLDAWAGDFLLQVHTGDIILTPDTDIKISTLTSNGLVVTSGGDGTLVVVAATTANIADSSNKRYVTDAQLVVIGNTSGTNTGDQTSIVGITGSLAEFNTALTGADFASGGGTVTGASSGTNTGDQTSIVGITGTKAQFDTAVTDGNILYVGDVTQYTDELAQDAVGGMVDTTLTYVDATPLLQRAALTGDVTASAGSNATTIANNAVTTVKILDANVTLAKIANAAANSKLLGSGAAGSGAPYAELTLGTGLSMSGTTLNAAGGGTIASTTNLLAGDGAGNAIAASANLTPPFGIAQPYVFDTTTSDSDPGSGKLRFNNATLASVTTIYADNNNALGTSITTWLDTYCSNSDVLLYGYQLNFTKKSDPAVYAQFYVISTIVDGTGYRKITVVFSNSAGSFSNNDDIILKAQFDNVYDNRVLPTGGTTGQALTKVNATNYNVTWSTITSDTAFASSWNGVTDVAPSKNAVYDELHKIDTADDGTIVNAGTGFRIAGAAASSKILKGNGTNFVVSTETYAAPGTSGNVMQSDGTNWTSAGLTYASIASGVTPGTITLAENTSIALDPAGSADGKYSGLTVTAISGYTQAFGDLVTLDKDDSRWEAVDISVAAAATGDARGIMGMVVSTGTDGNACTILLQGIIRADANFPALTIGAAVYASTSGDIVVAQPTTTDHVIRLVGYAMTADEIYFNPDPTWITHT